MAARFVIAALALVCVAQVRAISITDTMGKAFEGNSEVLAGCFESNKELAASFFEWATNKGNGDIDYAAKIAGLMRRSSDAQKIKELGIMRSQAYDKIKLAMESGDMVATVENIQTENAKIGQFAANMNIDSYLSNMLNQSAHEMGNDDRGLTLFSKLYLCRTAQA